MVMNDISSLSYTKSNDYKMSYTNIYDCKMSYINGNVFHTCNRYQYRWQKAKMCRYHSVTFLYSCFNDTKGNTEYVEQVFATNVVA